MKTLVTLMRMRRWRGVKGGVVSAEERVSVIGTWDVAAWLEEGKVDEARGGRGYVSKIKEREVVSK